MNAPIQQSQADILNRLYNMKQKQLGQALLQGNPLRCKVLEAEAEAISSALKSLRCDSREVTPAFFRNEIS